MRAVWSAQPRHRVPRKASGEFRDIWLIAKPISGPEVDNEDLIEGRKIIEIVCTTAHIGPTKHDKMDCRPEVLLFLCQRCHLREDGDEHRLNAADTRQRKKLEAARNAGQIQLVWP